MTKLIPLLGFYFFAWLPGSGQGILYKDLVYPGADRLRDLSYRGGDAAGKREKATRFDLYLPAGEPAGAESHRVSGRRPLIVWMHGGGFKFGSKNARGIRLWANSFARRGYVCAAINYRLSRKNALGNFGDLVLGCADAVADLRQAVAYFKTHAAEWKIDTSRIILAGNSAGGIIALQAAFSSPAELARLTGDTGRVGSTFRGPGVEAVINFWGAIFDTAWLANANTPIVSVHGSRDRIVPIVSRGANFFGSEAIHLAADRLALPNRIKIEEGYGHELQRHFIPFFVSRATKRRWEAAGQFAADFLYAVKVP